MSWSDASGQAVESPRRPMGLSKKRAADRNKTKDLVILGLRQQGWTWREIGDFVRISHESARNRYHKIPRRIRESLVRSACS